MRRFAIYYTPSDPALAAFGASWLGWDAATGTEPAPADIPGLPQPRDRLTAAPRKYGFHATLKPPFRLVQGADRPALEAAFARFCAQTAPAVAPGLVPTRLGGFLALTIDGEDADIRALAARIVEAFDGFRAPADAEELARRRKPGLSERQDAMLHRWGYPYVMDEFRFHMTLTGRVDPDMATRTLEALQPQLAPLLPRPFRLDGLALCGEDGDGRFHVLRRLPLSG